MISQKASTTEIQRKVQKGYLERLNLRVRKMRRDLADRNWLSLRHSCTHLKKTAPGFGLSGLTPLAQDLENAIREEIVPKAEVLSNVREPAERLFHQIDTILMEPR